MEKNLIEIFCIVLMVIAMLKLVLVEAEGLRKLWKRWKR